MCKYARKTCEGLPLLVFTAEFLSEVAYVNMLLRSWPGLRRHLPENKKKEEVTLLFLEVALFENSNKGEGGVDPFLPRSTTHSLPDCRVFW